MLKGYIVLILIIVILFLIIFWIFGKFYYWRKKNKKVIEETKKPLLEAEGFIKKFCTSGRKEAVPQNTVDKKDK